MSPNDSPAVVLEVQHWMKRQGLNQRLPLLVASDRWALQHLPKVAPAARQQELCCIVFQAQWHALETVRICRGWDLCHEHRPRSYPRLETSPCGCRSDTVAPAPQRCVVAAASVQLGKLNTNSRYLHDNIVHLAQRLTALMPRPLEVAIFVNSGTEANDLALRLARNHTGMRDVFCVDGAYHGNSAATLAISP